MLRVYTETKSLSISIDKSFSMCYSTATMHEQTVREEKIVIDPVDTYTRRHTMRRVLPSSDSRTVVSTLPLEVVLRAARKRGLELDEFLRSYDVEYLYDGIEGAFLRFVEKEKHHE